MGAAECWGGVGGDQAKAPCVRCLQSIRELHAAWREIDILREAVRECEALLAPTSAAPDARPAGLVAALAARIDLAPRCAELQQQLEQVRCAAAGRLRVPLAMGW